MFHTLGELGGPLLHVPPSAPHVAKVIAVCSAHSTDRIKGYLVRVTYSSADSGEQIQSDHCEQDDRGPDGKGRMEQTVLAHLLEGA